MPGAQEVRPEPVVEADAAGDVLDVRADELADVRDLVDEVMRVERNAFAAIFTISAEVTSVRTTSASTPSWSPSTASPSAASNAPITIRSGRMKSATALPSAVNSGFDT